MKSRRFEVLRKNKNVQSSGQDVEVDELGPIDPNPPDTLEHSTIDNHADHLLMESQISTKQPSPPQIGNKKPFGGLFSRVGRSIKEKVKAQHEVFLAEKRRVDQERRVDVATKPKKKEARPPWAGATTNSDLEAFLREEILRIPLNTQAFLHPLGSEVDFTFDMQAYYSEAIAALEADVNLKNLRFKVVPSHLSEEQFWQLYFYRVSKVYAEGNSLRAAGEDAVKRAVLESEAELEAAKRLTDSSAKIPPGVLLTGNKEWEMDSVDTKETRLPHSSEYISDHVNSSVEADISKELGQLGMATTKTTEEANNSANNIDLLGFESGAEAWQNELKQELGDSFADFDTGLNGNDPNWEVNIKAELHAELGLDEKIDKS